MGNGKLKCLDIRYHILDLTEFLWEVEGLKDLRSAQKSFDVD